MNSFNIFDFIFSVSLQPFEYDPQEKNRHKFMVQSMFAPEGDLNQDTLVNISLKTLHNKLKTGVNISQKTQNYSVPEKNET